MASRKRKPDSNQIGLGIPLTFSAPSTSPAREAPNDSPQGEEREDVRVMLSPTNDSCAEDLELDELDDYDDGAMHDDVPRLRLADPPRDAPRVIVESVGSMFEVSRLRDNGTTVACVMWTRGELEELQRRIAAALEIA